MPAVRDDAEPQVFIPDVQLHRRLLAEFGLTLTGGSRILDFGCGHGGMVRAYRLEGLQAFGADFNVERGAEWLRPIETTDGVYRLPFEDGTFDFIYSNSVLEHVQDLDAALTEMGRVLKSGGVTLHFFPPRGRPIEPHVLVPFGGMLRARPWLYLWALVGVRNAFQKGLGAARVAGSNYDYLHRHTFYRSKREFTQRLRRHFRIVVFADRQMIKHSYGRARRLSGLAEIVPALASAYGALHHRCVFCVK